MELVQKGQEANLENDALKQAIVEMSWNSAADFDLAVLIEKKSGGLDMCYFGSLGNLNGWPFMKLSGDAGIGDTVDSGGNKETMRIAKLDDDIAKAHIVVWDYGMVQKGKPARFSDSDVKVKLLDQNGSSHDVSLDTGDAGNVCILASIDNSSPIGAKLVNTSKAGTLKGLSNASTILEIVNS